MLTLKEIQAIRFAINNEPEPLRESPQNRSDEDRALMNEDEDEDE